ncbi:hypothetical protein BJX99DRAFT_194876 [Aspergillus californicus]
MSDPHEDPHHSRNLLTEYWSNNGALSFGHSGNYSDPMTIQYSPPTMEPTPRIYLPNGILETPQNTTGYSGQHGVNAPLTADNLCTASPRQHCTSEMTSPGSQWLSHVAYATYVPVPETNLTSQTTDLMLVCKWKDCRSRHVFHRDTDLLRHVKTIHIMPYAYPCQVSGCRKAFSRKDKVTNHMARVHRVQIG